MDSGQKLDGQQMNEKVSEDVSSITQPPASSQMQPRSPPDDKDLLRQKAAYEKEKGNQCFKNGQFKEAIDHFGELIKIDQSNPTIFCNRAMAFLKLEMYVEAKIDCDRAIHKFEELRKAFYFPAYFNAFCHRANAYLGMENKMAARTDLRRALQLEPFNPWATKEIKKLPQKWTVKGAIGETDLTSIGREYLDKNCPGWKDKNSYLIPLIPEFTSPDQTKMRLAITKIIDEQMVSAPFLAIHSLEVKSPRHQNYGKSQMLDEVFPLKGGWPDIDFDFLIVGPEIGVIIVEVEESKGRLVEKLEKKEKLIRAIIKALNLNICYIRIVICSSGLSPQQKMDAVRNNINVIDPSNIQSELSQYFLEEDSEIYMDDYESLAKTLVAITSMKGDGQTGDITLRLESFSIDDAM